MNLAINRELTDNGIKFSVAGYLDSINSYKFQLRLDEALKDGKNNIIVNMSKVEYICSIGLRILLKAYRTAIETGGKLGVEQPSENVKKVLVITSSADLLVV